MFRTLYLHLYDICMDPSRGKHFASLVSLVLATIPPLVWLVAPGYTLAALMVTPCVILAVWKAVYAEYIDNVQDTQPRVTLGARATLIQLRLATLSVAVIVLTAVALLLASGGTISAASMQRTAALGLIAVIGFLTVPALRKQLLLILLAICAMPFNAALMWYAATREDWEVASKVQDLNEAAKGLFARLSGYRSNLSVWQEVDEVLEGLPTRT